VEVILVRYPALRNRDFALILVGRTLSAFGNQFNMLALSLVVYRVTGSVAALGGMLAARVASRLFIQLGAGVLVDRLNLKRMLLTAELVNAVVAAALIYAARPELVWLVYVLVFILQSVEGFTGPGLNAGLTMVLDKDELPSGNALRLISGRVAALLGPALAGVLFAAYGPALLFGANAASFLLSFLFLVFVRSLTGPQGQRERAPFLQSLVEGFKVIGSMPQLLTVIVLVGAAAMVWGVLQIAIIPMAEGPLHLDERGLGLLFTTLALGGLAGSFVTPLIARGVRTEVALAFTYLLVCIPFLTVVIYPLAAVAFVVMFLNGLLADSAGIFSTTTLQTLTPPTHLGRVFALMNVSMALGVLPVVLFVQPLVDRYGPEGPLAVAAVLMALFSGAALYYLTVKWRRGEVSGEQMEAGVASVD